MLEAFEVNDESLVLDTFSPLLRELDLSLFFEVSV